MKTPSKELSRAQAKALLARFRNQFRDPSSGKSRPSWAHLCKAHPIDEEGFIATIKAGCPPLFLIYEHEKRAWEATAIEVLDFISSLGRDFGDFYIVPSAMEWCLVWGVDSFGSKGAA